MLILSLFIALLQQARGLIPQATTVSIGNSIRYELLLAANNDKANTAFIPRNQADLDDILLTVASEKLRFGDPVEESTVKYAKTIHVLPFQYSVNGYTGNLVEDYIMPYFMDSYRMVSLGDTFSTRGGEWAPQFKVVSIEGYRQQEGDSYIVGPETKILRARGVVEESGHNRDSQFQDGSARSFHVSTVSDIPSDIRTDKIYARQYSENLSNKNIKIPTYKKSTLMIDSGDSTHDAWMKDEIRDFKKFLVWKYRSCATVKDLLLATGGHDVLRFLSEKGAVAPASLIINSFFQNESESLISEIMNERGVSVPVCMSLFSSFAEEGKVHAKTVLLNSMEIQLGKGMKQQGPAAKKFLDEKYKNSPTLKELLITLKTTPDALSSLTKSECKISTSSIIEYFTTIHKMSFLDKMEENGIPFHFGVTVFFAFHRDMSNVPLPGSGRRWPFRALIKNIITGVVSLFNRPKSII